MPPGSSLDPQTIADLLTRFRDRGGDPDRLIVIGGAASVHWAVALMPDSDVPFRTVDLDFQMQAPHGFEKLLERFADAVGGELALPGREHHTPELAHVEIPDFYGPSDNLIVDFLPGPYGLRAHDVERRARYVDVEAGDGRVLQVRMAHPVHLLVGTAENYMRLPRYRHEAILIRVDGLISVVRRYLGQVAQEAAASRGDSAENRRMERDARWSMQQLLRLSAKPAYADYHRDTGRDLTDAIPTKDEAPVDPKFWASEYPQRVAMIRARRQASLQRQRKGHRSR